jgi:primosomal protein N' (replication factor Y)
LLRRAVSISRTTNRLRGACVDQIERCVRHGDSAHRPSVAAEATFDYWIPEGLVVERGALVRVRLARRSLTGVVVDVAPLTDVPREKLQPIDELRSEIPALPADVLELARFVATYYQEPLGLALAQMLPPLASAASRKVRAALPQDAGATDRGSNARAVSQNPEQQRACEALSDVAGSFAPCLLQGVTGSGKTEVYLSAAAERIAADGQVLILVPEINLTPQFHERIRDALPGRRTVTLHSRLSPAQRRANWCRAATGEADLVLGTRLAVFTPLPRLSLIVVDEEHDPSFKQQDGVRYSGRDVAIWRARQRRVPVVLGSATPSLESLTHAKAGRYRWLKLPRRAAAAARLPAVHLAGNRDAAAAEGIGAPLLEAIAERLQRAEQSLVLHQSPRLRGLAPVLGLRLASGMSALQRAARGASRDGGSALPPLRSHRAPCAHLPGLRQRGSRPDRPWHAAARASARRALSAGAHRAHRSRQHEAQGRFLRRARARPRGRGRHPGRHADARQGPRLPAA